MTIVFVLLMLVAWSGIVSAAPNGGIRPTIELAGASGSSNHGVSLSAANGGIRPAALITVRR